MTLVNSSVNVCRVIRSRQFLNPLSSNSLAFDQKAKVDIVWGPPCGSLALAASFRATDVLEDVAKGSDFVLTENRVLSAHPTR